jgi:predicted ester cyclase
VGVDEHKETYRRNIEAIGRNDPEALDPLVTPDVVDHNPGPDQPPGIDGFKEWIRAVKTSFPDLEATVEEVIGEGDKVAGRVTWRGTHRGEFMGLPSTNREVSFQAFHVVRFLGGLAAEWWGNADLVGALRQLGGTIGPSPGSSA